MVAAAAAAAEGRRKLGVWGGWGKATLDINFFFSFRLIDVRTATPCTGQAILGRANIKVHLQAHSLSNSADVGLVWMMLGKYFLYWTGDIGPGQYKGFTFKPIHYPIRPMQVWCG
jgi:hypothetical protein